MKKVFILIAASLILLNVLSSCYNYHSNDDVSISIKEDDNEYRLSARFDDRKTRAIQNYICEFAEQRNFFKAGHHIDGTVTLDDNTRVYIKSYEGHLKIKFDKEENSDESYEKVQEMCEGIKELLAEN